MSGEDAQKDVAFDLVFGDAKHPTPQKLEKRLNTPKHELTREELDAKLHAAEERAKSFENDRMLKGYVEVEHAKQVHAHQADAEEIRALELAMKIEGGEQGAEQRRRSIEEQRAAKARADVQHAREVAEAHRKASG